MEEDVILLLLGALLGGFVSLLIWYLFTHYFVSKLKFSEKIQKINYSEDYNQQIYRVRIMNTGSRTAIDLNLRIRVSLRGIKRKGVLSWYDLPSLSLGIPRMKPGEDRAIVINPNIRDTFSNSSFPENIRNKATSGNLSIEDLLRANSDNQLKIYVFAYDSLSGARKLFVSKPYNYEDIALGKFEGLELIEAADKYDKQGTFMKNILNTSEDTTSYE